MLPGGEGEDGHHIRAPGSNVHPGLIELAIDGYHEDGTDHPDGGKRHHCPRRSVVVFYRGQA